MDDWKEEDKKNDKDGKYWDGYHDWYDSSVHTSDHDVVIGGTGNDKTDTSKDTTGTTDSTTTDTTKTDGDLFEEGSCFFFFCF